MSSRQFAPDLLKAVAIFGVVFIHTQSRFDNPLTQALSDLSRVAVPCFIILFAYFFEKALLKSREPLRYTAQRFGHITVVFVIWSTLYLFLKESWTMPTLLSWLVRHYSGGAWPGQYFFLIIMQLIPLFLVFRWVYRVKWFRWFSIITIVILYFVLGYSFDSFPYLIQKLGLRPCIYHIPYVFTGIALAHGAFIKIRPIWSLVLILIPLEFYLLKHFGRGFDAYLTPGVLISSILLSAVALQSELRPPKTEWLHIFISEISGQTMTIFVANPIIIRLLSTAILPIYPSFTGTILTAISALAMTSITVVLCLLIARLINRLSMKGILN